MESMGDDLEVMFFDPSYQHGHLPTVRVVVVYIILTVILEVTAVVLYLRWPPNALQCEPLLYFLFSHAIFWALTLIFDHYLKWRHHTLYLRGYLSFSEIAKKLSAFPFHIVSLSNAILLALVAWYHSRNDELEPACHQSDIKSPVGGALAVISAEALLLLIVLVNYAYKVYLFNTSKSLPDLELRGDWALESFIDEQVGLRERVDKVEELLRKQADIIRFYKDESEVLKKKILSLNSQLRGESIN